MNSTSPPEFFPASRQSLLNLLFICFFRNHDGHDFKSIFKTPHWLLPMTWGFAVALFKRLLLRASFFGGRFEGWRFPIHSQCLVAFDYKPVVIRAGKYVKRIKICLIHEIPTGSPISNKININADWFGELAAIHRIHENRTGKLTALFRPPRVYTFNCQITADRKSQSANRNAMTVQLD